MQQLSFALGEEASPYVPQPWASGTSLGWEAPDTHRSDQEKCHLCLIGPGHHNVKQCDAVKQCDVCQRQGQQDPYKLNDDLELESWCCEGCC